MRAVCAGLRHLPRHLRYVSNVSSLPYRIRAPLARLKESKVEPAEAFRAPALGDGESLETDAKDPDFVALALRSRVYDHLTDTPLQHALALSERLGANVHIKREDLMPTFTFYARCAINQLALIKASAGPQALVTASIGSRGHALAWAAERLGMNLTVVMPLATPTSRREAVSRLGAKVIIHGDSVHDANEEAARLAASQGMIAVGSHDDASVIAATGTVALELLRQHGAADVAAAAALAASVHGRPPSRSVARRSTAMPLDAIFVSVGGGSLLAGVASVIKALSPRTKVIGVEPATADVLSRSLLSGHRVTDVGPEGERAADGVFVSQIGEQVFRICDELVDDVLLVDEIDISSAVADVFLDTRAVLEPNGAIALAGLKQFAAKKQSANNDANASLRRPSYIAIGSDASNVEFSSLQRVAQEGQQC